VREKGLSRHLHLPPKHRSAHTDTHRTHSIHCVFTCVFTAYSVCSRTVLTVLCALTTSSFWPHSHRILTALLHSLISAIHRTASRLLISHTHHVLTALLCSLISHAFAVLTSCLLADPSITALHCFTHAEWLISYSYFISCPPHQSYTHSSAIFTLTNQSYGDCIV
jgi:hypothetical protein